MTASDDSSAKPKPKRKRKAGPKQTRLGAPSIYTDALAETICERIAHGESLRAVCEDSDMPSTTTVTKWLGQKPDFAAQYAHARERQADFYADEMVEIADTTTDAHKARLQIDARKWKASKLAPKKYGDKLSVDATVDVTSRDTAELASAFRAMLGLDQEGSEG